MKLCIISALVAILVSPGLAAADDGVQVGSKSRDSSAAFIATQNFIVGRLGRDCLGELGRSETPLEYQKKWQKDNAKYFDAATKYMEVRLSQLEDPEQRDAVERAYYASAERTGEAAVGRQFSNGTKRDVCQYAITLVDAGSMNIEAFVKSAKLPVMQDLEELVNWATAK
jgi:hypothetical protein